MNGKAPRSLYGGAKIQPFCLCQQKDVTQYISSFISRFRRSSSEDRPFRLALPLSLFHACVSSPTFSCSFKMNQPVSRARPLATQYACDAASKHF